MPTPISNPSLGTPATIGKYRIVREVGVGGMAEVFLASREGPEGFSKPYVIKRILPQYSQDEQFARLFVTEAKIAALLDHPNIVHVFDFEIDRGNYYLVMEYVAGASLLGIMRASVQKGLPLGPQVAAEVATGVAHALAYAHDLTLPDGTRLDLVHRDISPGNILISRDGAVKLADFGVVKTSVTETPLGIITGKWAYMSPEQIGAQAIDRRSDLFSLGIITYEVATGRRLFRGSTSNDTVARVKSAIIPRPRTIVPDLDPLLDQIIMRLLERDPRTRYQSAAELVTDLENLRITPAFLGGSLRLRTLVRSLFPDEQSAALAASTTPRPTPMQGFARITPGSLSRITSESMALAVPAAALRSPPEDPSEAPRLELSEPTKTVTWRLIAALTLACLAASALFWLLVL